jgi:hypothetical protein
MAVFTFASQQSGALMGNSILHMHLHLVRTPAQKKPSSVASFNAVQIALQANCLSPAASSLSFVMLP